MKMVSVQTVVVLLAGLLVLYLVVRNLSWILFNVLRREYEKRDIYQLMEIAELELEKGHLSKAHALIKGILRQKNGEVGARVLLARVLRAKGNTRDAKAVLFEILREFPNHAGAKKEMDELRNGT